VGMPAWGRGLIWWSRIQVCASVEARTHIENSVVCIWAGCGGNAAVKTPPDIFHSSVEPKKLKLGLGCCKFALQLVKNLC